LLLFRQCKEAREYDKHIDKERSLVEGFIGKLKPFRRVFPLFEKWAKNDMYFIRFSATLNRVTLKCQQSLEHSRLF